MNFLVFFCSRSHISQEISSLLEVLFKKVILKIGSLAAIFYENINKIFCLYLNVCWINLLKRIPIPFIILPKQNRQSYAFFRPLKWCYPLTPVETKYICVVYTFLAPKYISRGSEYLSNIFRRYLTFIEYCAY